ncbi:MAG: porin [Nitrosomonas sp.]|nr:porin [Nitrosomonas sp.]
MQSKDKKLTLKKLPLAVCGVFLLASSYTHAGDFSPLYHPGNDTGLIESVTGYKYNESNFMQSLGIKAGGWTEIGANINAGDRSHNRGGNAPVTFNDQPNSFNLHQVYGYIEREVNRNTTNALSFGFRADLLYGTDARFTSATNFDSNVLGHTDPSNPHGDRKLVFPQAYVDIYMPIGNGLVASVGHFYTIIGYEVVPAAGNFFMSHAYTMQYGEPFTHTGAMLTYPLNDNIELKGGVVSGWDAHFKQPANFLGSVAYTTDNEQTSITGSLITGDVNTNYGGGGGLVPNNNHNRTLYSVVLEHSFTERLHYVLQHDLGIEENTSTSQAAKWYGLNQYMFYDIAHNLGAGIRMEWFRDEDGVRVQGNGISENYIGVTGGLNYRPIAGFTLRPEVRYDVSTNQKAYDGGTDDDQFLATLSGIFRF